MVSLTTTLADPDLEHVPATRAVARLRGVRHVFGHPPHAVEVLPGVDLDLFGGQLTLINGPSGSGKTTLLSILGLLLEPTEGAVEICRQDVSGCDQRELAAIRRERISFIFQGFNLLTALSARENVQVGLQLQGVNRRDASVGALDLLTRVGMHDRARHRPAQMSCGQQQRVAIARALASPAPLLLADEPTGNLDSTNALQVVELLHGLAHEEQRAVVVVTHDPRLERFADRIINLEDGRIARDTKEEI